MISTVLRPRAARRSRLTAGLLTGMLLAGCQQIPAGPRCDATPLLQPQVVTGPTLVPMVPGTVTPIPLNTAQIIDPAIAGRVMIQSVVANRSATGTLQVTVRLVNCGDIPLGLQGRTSFLDAQQMPTEPASAWQGISLPAHSMAVYSESSTDAQRSAQFLIELRGLQ